ncbi:hypothetical protein QUB80_26405 [Chlorogloeopsis sp. ULAP01]|uniref:hypothetical protein n=1 Tax=Chlorogloeopsis sp. ULAP01 TaxID=3056483 RepID=UPI0025AA51C8|nr:hypothetical protein [Chlorogloeopsis sp. ULAP01]MDM9384213.1 hypothetical protein [Chlorogloeopsis sp. ULAP01]
MRLASPGVTWHRVKRVVDAQRAASCRVAPGVTWRRVKRVECDCRAGLKDKLSV